MFAKLIQLEAILCFGLFSCTLAVFFLLTHMSAAVKIILGDLCDASATVVPGNVRISILQQYK